MILLSGHNVYVHVIATALSAHTRIPCCIQLPQGIVDGSTGICGELRGNVIR